MPSTDRRLELKAKDIDGSDRLTAGCVFYLGSPAVSRTAVYANGLIEGISTSSSSSSSQTKCSPIMFSNKYICAGIKTFKSITT
jgi:hypothetical protein